MRQALLWLAKRMKVGYLWLVFVLMSGVIILMGWRNVQPIQHNFEEGQVADVTVQAPYTLEDEDQTWANRKSARDSVSDVYSFDMHIREHQMELVDQYFNFVRSLQRLDLTTEDLVAMSQELPEDASQWQGKIDQDARTNQQSVNFLQLRHDEQLIVYLAKAQQLDEDTQSLAQVIKKESVIRLINAKPETLETIQATISEILNEHLAQELAAADIGLLLARLDYTVSQSDFNNYEQTILRDLLKQLVVPTVVYSQKETAKKKELAAEQIQPAYVLQGQVIVQEGHIITANNMRVLDLYGFLDATQQKYTFFGFLLLVLLHVLLLAWLVTDRWTFKVHSLELAQRYSTAYGLAFMVGMAFLKLFQIFQALGLNYVLLAFPIALLPILVAKVTRERLGLVIALFFNLFTLFIIKDNDRLTGTAMIALFYLFSTMINYLVVVKSHPDSRRLTYRYYLTMILAHLGVIYLLTLAFNISVWSQQGIELLMMVLINVSLTVIVHFLIYPYWEQLFDDRSRLTLSQLADLEHPLLRELIMRAPGTYQHSMVVANLSASAVAEIGGDSLMTRVACYYHDVGKLVNPTYFVENLHHGMASPHDQLSPSRSAEIIISHVPEGVKRLEAYDMPQCVIDICLQHHGTTMVQYFYYQARQVDAEVSITDFQYAGPKPQTKEAAVIMIADSVEAASRTMKEYTQESISQLVDKIIQGKIKEDQFDEADLTVADLVKVRNSLINSVSSMYHSRVEYPSDQAQDDKE